MGIGKLIEEVAGSIAAEDALKAVDPNAGFFSEAAAAIAGFEGVGALTGLLGEKTQKPPESSEDQTS